jgi:hypothetical protein
MFVASSFVRQSCPIGVITSWAFLLLAGEVNLHLQAQGVRITTGTIVDATILHAPTSTKNL